MNGTNFIECTLRGMDDWILQVKLTVKQFSKKKNVIFLNAFPASYYNAECC